MKYIVLSGLLLGLLSACSEKPKEPTLPPPAYIQESSTAGQPVIEQKPVTVISSEPVASAPVMEAVKVIKKEDKPKEVKVQEQKSVEPKENASDSVSEVKTLKHAKIIAKKKEASGPEGETLKTSLLSVDDGLLILGR